MLKQYFAQSMLNEGILSADQVRFLLENEKGRQAGIEIKALCKHILSAAQIDDVKKRQKNGADFADAAMDAGYLTASQRRSLEEMETTTNLDFAQGMMDEGLVSGYDELERLVEAYEAAEIMTVGLAVNQLAMRSLNFSDLEGECGLYSEYADVFLRSIARFMDTTAFINLQPEPFNGEQRMVTISQRLTGDVILTTGIMAEEDVLLAMARSYSKEDIDSFGDLAIDSVEEFLNVTNGLYIVNLSNRQLSVDLDPARCARNVLPAGNKQLVVRIDIKCGSFDLILAADEIIF